MSAFYNASPIKSNDLDTNEATTLTIGGINANKLEIASLGVDSEFKGPVLTDEIDALNNTTLIIGNDNATKLEFARSSVESEFLGPVNINSNLDVIGLLKVNNIYNFTTGNGVNVEDVMIIDGLVDGRDVSVDGATLDAHVANTNNPHFVTIDQVTPTTTKGDIIVETGTSADRFPVGVTDGMLLSVNSALPYGIEWIVPQDTDSGVVSTVVADRKSVGTNGGTFASGAWRTRDLNTLTDSEGGTTSTPSAGGIYLDTTNSRMVIPFGTYFMIAQATAYRVNENRARFQVIGASQTTKVETIADSSGSLSGTYFDIDTTTTAYRIWFDVANTSSAPSAGGRTLLEVNINFNDSADDVATALTSAINTQSSFHANIRSNRFVIIRNRFVGSVTSAVDGDTGFTITTLNTGNTTTSTVDISLSIYAKDSAQGTAVSANITTQFTFTETKVCELQHRCADSKNNDGFGVAAGIDGLDEQYSTIFFHKIKVGSID